MLNSESSVLKIYLGCMYSGKSTALINEMTRYSTITNKILVVNSVLDKARHNYIIEEKFTENYSGFIKTHDNKSCSAVMVENLIELINDDNIKNKYRESKVIIIDEAQFYKDIYTFIKDELENTKNNKIFIIGGLNGSSNLEPIGDFLKLIPFADEIIKLEAYCIYCKNGTTASFTKRLVENNCEILIGKENTYAPVCRKHYYDINF